MKFAGIILLCGGFAIVPVALGLLPAGTSRTLFVLAGIAVQIGGLALTFRAHYTLDEEH
jgi:hypothetical protein